LPGNRRGPILGRMKSAKAKTLATVLVRHNIGLRFVVARLDGSALLAAWPGWKNRRVKGEINGFGFRTTLFPAKKGTELVLVVNRKMQAAAKVGPGDRVKLKLEPDTETTGPTVPKELTDTLKGERPMAQWFAGLPPSMKKEIAGYVDAAKGATTRRERATRMAESLMLAMEGERELPPILRAGFQGAPGAAEGWQAMTATQRRNHLLGIFYVQTVEGRARRAAKAVENAVRVAGRQRGKGSSGLQFD